MTLVGCNNGCGRLVKSGRCMMCGLKVTLGKAGTTGVYGTAGTRTPTLREDLDAALDKIKGLRALVDGLIAERDNHRSHMEGRLSVLEGELANVRGLALAPRVLN